MENFSLDNFFGENTLMRATELFDTVHKETFTIKDLSISYAEVRRWDSSGLLGTTRTKEASWRKFNFLDYLWLQLVDEMKRFGASGEVILGLREKLYETIPFSLLLEIAEADMEKSGKTQDKESFEGLKDFLQSKERTSLDKEEGISLLFLLLIESITTKVPVSIVLFSDGDFFIWNEDKKIYSKEQIEKLAYESYMSLSMAKVIRKFLYNNESSFIIPQLNILKENEIKLLEIINTGEYESITINFKNKKMQSLNLIKEQDVKKKVVDVLAMGGYQDITIKTHNGMITKIQNTVKVRLD